MGTINNPIASARKKLSPQMKTVYQKVETERMGKTMRISSEQRYPKQSPSASSPPLPSTRDTDPINILIRRSAIPEDVKLRNKINPTDADILEQEYNLEMFRVLSQREYRQITRYDTWEKDLTPKEWVEKCLSSGDDSNGLSPVYNGKDYVWQPVKVEGYDYEAQKYMVKVLLTGQRKSVTRLALRFNYEDDGQFNLRLKECRDRREIVETELRFQELADSVRTEDVTHIPANFVAEIEKKMQIREDNFSPLHVKETGDRVMNVIESIFRLTMKKCYMINDMQSLKTISRLLDIKIPPKIGQCTPPYLALLPVKRGFKKMTMPVRMAGEFGMTHSLTVPKFSRTMRVNEISATPKPLDSAVLLNKTMTLSQVRIKDKKRLTRDVEKLISWQTGNSVVGILFDEFQMLSQKFKPKSLFKTDFQKIEPMRSSNFMNQQEKRIRVMSTDVLNSWRFQTLHEIRQRVKGEITFDISNMEMYENSKAKTLIRKFDIIFNYQLGDFFNNSLQDLLSFVQKFTIPKDSELWKISDHPLLEIDIAYTGSDKKQEEAEKKKKHSRDDKTKKLKKLKLEKSIFFNPSLEDCKAKLLSLLDKLIDTSDKVSILETEDYNVFLSNVKRKAHLITNETPELKKARIRLTRMIDECCVGPTDLLEKFKKYLFLITANTQDQSKIMENEAKPTLEELRTKLDEYSRAQYEVQTLAINKVQFSMFQIDTRYIKKYLSYRAKKLKEALLKSINRYCNNTIKDIEKKYAELQTNLEEKPTTKEAYKVLKNCLNHADTRVNQLRSLHELVGLHIELLEDHLTKVDKDVYNKFFTLYCCPSQIRSTKIKGDKNKINYEEQLKLELDRQKDLFDKQLEQYKIDYEEVIQFQDIESAQNKYRSASELQENIKKALEKAKEINEDEELLEMKKTEHSVLNKLEKDFKPFWSLIFDADEIKGLMEGWCNNPFIGLKHSEIIEKIDSWLTELDNINKQLEEFKEQGDVAIDLKNIVQDFTKHLDLIRYLRSEAMKEEEWNQIGKVTPLKFKYNDEALTLNVLLKNNASNYMEQIREIWDCAEKKLDLEKTLKKMKDEMNKRRLEVYKDEKTDTYLVRNYSVLLEAIDDQVGATEAMLVSPYINGILRRACTAWSSRLTSISDILEELKKCQNMWLYLQPLFASENLQLTLKREYEKFGDVDLRFKQQTEPMNIDSFVVSLLEKERIKEDFIRANEDLENVLRSMADYLESIRKKFPRFYFISDADLVHVISNAKNDLETLQPYFQKCFEGIRQLEIVCPSQEVTAIVSQEDEKVQLIRILGLKEGDRKGNVEVWLNDLEKIIHETLQDLCKRSIKDNEVTEKLDWIKTWPGQIALLVNQITWTANSEAALDDNRPKALEEYNAKLNAEVNKMVSLAHGELDDLNRLKIEILLTFCAHSKDVIRNLCERNVKEKTDFEWISQIRFNYTKDEVEIAMLTARINYGFEYIGNYPRLVITPLTSRCYRILMTAKQMCQGVILKGPAGAGKTETIKDLTKTIGGYCVVFNASEELNHTTVAKVFKGITSAGAWCCFDELNKIDPEVLSILSAQLLLIQRALIMKQAIFQLNGEEVALNPSCGINITINPVVAGHSFMSDSIRTLFRPFSMTIPDYLLIGETILYSYGFHQAKNLSKKILDLLKLCEEQLSIQEHYDFGMRTLQTVLRTMKLLRRKLPEESEEEIARKALNDTNLPKLVNKDIPLYEGFLSDLFTTPEDKAETNPLIKAIGDALISENLQIAKEYVKKCIQIYETTLTRNGVIIIGKTFSGKTEAIRTLKKALSTLKEFNSHQYASMIVRSLNPKAVEQNQLYGFFCDDSKTWCDGIFSKIIIDYTESETPDEKWVVFDGPVDGVWIENMNTVLDDNKKLCLASGSVIKLKPNITILFEVEQLKYASPAVVSRCGMVFMQSQHLSWELLVKSYIELLPQILTSKKLTAIEEVLMSSLKLTLTFIDKYGKFLLDVDSKQAVKSVLNIFESFISDSRLEGYKLSNDLDGAIPNFALFSLVYGIGSYLEPSCKGRFNEFIQDIVNGKDVNMKYKLELSANFAPPKIHVRLSENCNIFNIMYQRKKNEWVEWMNVVDDPFAGCGNKTSFYDLVVPSTDSRRTRFMINQFVNSAQHILLVGSKGVGKTTNIRAELKRSFSNSQYMYITLSLSATITAKQAQQAIEYKLEKHGRKYQYAPLKGKKGVVFIDDLNMPNKDAFESQPPLELLRQWMDYKGWYDINSKDYFFKTIENISFVSAMNQPGGQTVTARYLRHYTMLYIEDPDEKTMKSMFQTLLDWKLVHLSSTYGPAILNQTKNLVNATVQTLLEVTKNPSLRPVPIKSHYIFGSRDISRVMQGICRSSANIIKTIDDMIKLWAHECMRVFKDRLISLDDRTLFMGILKKSMKDNFDKEWENTVTSEPLMFGSFVPCATTNAKGEEEFVLGFYSEIADKALLKSTIEDAVSKYNAENRIGSSKLVLFMYAIKHIAIIHRILTLPRGHALLVGVGGLGQKSLTSLAMFIGKYLSFKIESSAEYKFQDWRNDLRTLMSMTGVDKNPTVLLLNNEQMSNNEFMEDINSILTTGEVPNLYIKEGKTNELMVKLRESIQLHSKKTINSDEEALEILNDNCRKFLRVVFSLNPTMKQFRQELRKFPSILNYTSIDWFLPWPEEALRTVAEQYLVETDLPSKERNGIINICVDMQERVRLLAEQYEKDTQFRYYVTPTHYLELLRIFKRLLDERKEIFKGTELYDTGLKELKKTETFVSVMKDKLIEMEPEQKTCNENAIRLTESLRKKKIEVQEETKRVQQDEEKAEEIKKIADELQAECQANHDKALPELKEAENAIKAIDPSSISTMQSMPSPSEALKPVAKALCIILNIKPKSVPKSEPDYWLPKKIFTHKNMKKLADYDKENIPLAKITELKKVTESPEFATEKIVIVSAEAEAIARWIRALVYYDQVNREVAPLKIRLKEESEKALAAQESLAKTSKELEEKKARSENLKQELDAAEHQKKKLTMQIENTKKKIDRARELLDLLKNESKRWNEHLNNLKERSKNFLGDIVVSSGIIAYLGVFPGNCRESCVNAWLDLLTKFEIAKSSTFSLFDTLYDSMQKFIWQKECLPTDSISIDNAIIMERSQRWPLFIDPQRQAVNWIKTRERVEVIKQSQKSKQIINKLSSAISHGIPILFEDMDDNVDPRLNSLIKKEVRIEGGQKVIKVSGESVLFNSKFKFYIATRLSRPHYSPDICAEVTMLNFVATEEALTDHMLNIIVKKEDTATQRNREAAIQNSVDVKQRLKKKEEEVLRIVTLKKEEILESDTLLETLKNTKLECQKFISQMEEQKKANEKIEVARSKFKPVAKRVASLYFCVAGLAKIEYLYQYSLEWYIELYQKALEVAPETEQEEKLKLYKSNFTRLIFNNVSKSLLEKDRLLFTLSLLLNIFVSDELNTPVELKCLLTGTSSSTVKAPENPVVNWLSDRAWNYIYDLSQNLPQFKDFDLEIKNNSAVWQKLSNSVDFINPTKQPWPNGWSDPEKLNHLRQLMIINAMKPERFIEAVYVLIAECLGKDYLEYPSLNIDEAYSSSSHKIPVLFILSPGADPISELKAFLSRKKVADELIPLSLGKGQIKEADLAITTALEAKAITWVIMQNCHYAKSYLHNLEKRLEEIPEESKSPFRLWLTSAPTDSFPITLLQNCIKIANEQPKGIAKNMMNVYSKLDMETFNLSTPKPAIWKKLLHRLVMFHAVVQERAKYGTLGWNQVYDFSYSDFAVSLDQLKNFAKTYPSLPWTAMNYYIAETNYGGHIDDAVDLKKIKAMFSDFFSEEAMKDGYKLCENKAYGFPGDLKAKDQYIKFAKSLPQIDDPEVFGLNWTVKITCSLEQSNQLLNALTTMTYSAIASPSVSREESEKRIRELLESVPNEFDIEECTKKFPYNPTQCHNIVLLKELNKYNHLISVIRKSLDELQAALQGNMTMTSEMEDIIDHLLKNKVPKLWKDNSYPSMKPASVWIENLKKRVKFFQEWVDKGTTTSYWISAFFLPQAFFTAILQNYSRTNKLPIDSLTLDYTVIPEAERDIHSECVIYGLFIEGAKWNAADNCLEEVDTTSIYSAMSPLLIQPKEIAALSQSRNVYECPVYNTEARQESVAANGHSATSIMTVNLPISSKDTVKHWIKRGVAMVAQLNC